MNLIKTLRPVRRALSKVTSAINALEIKAEAVSDRLDKIQPQSVGNRAWSRADRFHDRLENILISLEADKQALEELLEEFVEDAKQSKQ